MKLKKFLSTPNLLRVFIMDCWISSNAFLHLLNWSCGFVFYSIDIVYLLLLLLLSHFSNVRLCVTPKDTSPPGSPIPGILQARTLEWVVISFSNAWKWKVKVKSLNRIRLLATPWTAAYQAPPPIGFSRQEYWVGCHYWCLNVKTCLKSLILWQLLCSIEANSCRIIITIIINIYLILITCQELFKYSPLLTHFLVAQWYRMCLPMQEMHEIPGWERSPGVGNGSPLQYPCLENSMDRGA